MFRNYTNKQYINNLTKQLPNRFEGLNAHTINGNQSVHKPQGMNDGSVEIRNTSVDGVQVGSGISPTNMYMLYKAVKAAVQSDIGQKIRADSLNKLGEWANDENPNWRPDYPGELHYINERGATYNFLGPGTKIRARLARGDPPLDGETGMDDAARTHDIAYTNATNYDDIRRADEEFIEKVRQSNVGPFKKNFIP